MPTAGSIRERILMAIAGEDVGDLPVDAGNNIDNLLIRIAKGGAIAGMIADAYDATSTYSKDDLCTHEGKLYKAKQDIGTAEAWTAAHWDETTLADELGSVDPSAIAEAVGDWLDDHVDPETGYVVDDTLSITDAAADAKKTGDEIADLKSAIEQYDGIQAYNVLGKNLYNPNTITDNKFLKSDGTFSDSNQYEVSDFIPVEYGETYFFTNRQQRVDLREAGISQTRYLSLLYDEDKAAISATYQNQDNVLGLQVSVNNADAKYVRLCFHKQATDYVQFEKNSTWTQYEPYTAQEQLEIGLGGTAANQVKAIASADAVANMRAHKVPIVRTKQLFDRSKLQVGYVGKGGYITVSGTSYRYTEFIDVSEHVGDTMYFSNNGTATNARFITAFDANQHPIAASGVDGDATSYTVPSGVYYVILTFYATDTHCQAEYDEITSYAEYGEFFELGDAIANYNILYGKKWAVCGDSFTAGGGTGTTITEGKYAGKNYTYPWLIGNRNNMEIAQFFTGGKTLAFPAEPGDFTNSLTCSTNSMYYQNIPANVDYITIYLGINDYNKNEDIPIGTISDDSTATYYGAWNVVLTWLIVNRPNAHIGIIVTNGIDGHDEYRQAQIAIATKYGLPYIDMNGDSRTPAMLRTSNTNIPAAIKSALITKWAVDPTGTGGTVNTHPNDAAQLFESTYIENFLRSI